MKGEIDHPVLGKIIVSQTRRAKRVSVSIKSDGTVRLSLPFFCSVKEGLRFIEHNQKWILDAKDRQQSKKLPIRTKEEIKEIRKIALEKLPPMCVEVSKRIGLEYNSLSIRVARTRWGSCSSKNNVSLSIFLAKLPDHLIEYIIIHELCHTVHKNHSAKFHALVDSFLGGNEKKLNKELKAYLPN